MAEINIDVTIEQPVTQVEVGVVQPTTNVNIVVGRAFSLVVVDGITLFENEWGANGHNYHYDIVNANITADSVVYIIPTIESCEAADHVEIRARTLAGSGTLRIYGHRQANDDIDISIHIFKPITNG